MSCVKCDDFQELGHKIYYRWKNANIEINGCRDHILQIFEVLNKAQTPDKYPSEEKETNNG